MTDPAEAPPPRPRWIAAALLAWLALLVFAGGFVAVVLLSSADDYIESTAFQLVLCVIGGGFGAAVAALLRAVERIAQGWVDADAPPAHGFSARIAPLLAVQPVFGAALGLLLFLVLSAAVAVLLRLADGSTFDPQGLLLVAAVAGLFARTLLTRLRDMFESLLGRDRAREGAQRPAARGLPAAAPGTGQAAAAVPDVQAPPPAAAAPPGEQRPGKVDIRLADAPAPRATSLPATAPAAAAVDALATASVPTRPPVGGEPAPGAAAGAAAAGERVAP